MKKIFAILASAVLCMSLAFAQEDERIPGLYAVDGDLSTPLTVVNGSFSSSGFGIGVIEVSKRKILYSGATSDTRCTGKFVLVCDMNKKAIVATFKKYDVFIKSMTPDNMIIIPLAVEKKKRVYDEGASLNGMNTQKRDRCNFSWQQISDNSYEITADLEPGEYAFVFKPAKLGEFEFNKVFDFTITAPGEE